MAIEGPPATSTYQARLAVPQKRAGNSKVQTLGEAHPYQARSKTAPWTAMFRLFFPLQGFGNFTLRLLEREIACFKAPNPDHVLSLS